MGAIKFFDALDYLEPKCPGCETKLEYGINTTFSEERNCHVCNKCGTAVK